MWLLSPIYPWKPCAPVTNKRHVPTRFFSLDLLSLNLKRLLRSALDKNVQDRDRVLFLKYSFQDGVFDSKDIWLAKEQWYLILETAIWCLESSTDKPSRNVVSLQSKDIPLLYKNETFVDALFLHSRLYCKTGPKLSGYDPKIHINTKKINDKKTKSTHIKTDFNINFVFKNVFKCITNILEIYSSIRIFFGTTFFLFFFFFFGYKFSYKSTAGFWIMFSQRS